MPGQTPLLTPDNSSVILAFACEKWRVPWPRDEFLATGRKPEVDTRLGDRLSIAEDSPAGVYDVLGEGLLFPDFAGSPYGFGADFYQDHKGVRLIAIAGAYGGSDTIILSARSKHAARPISEDLAALRTDSGIGLGDPAARVLKILGEPSARHEFGDYEIYWYIGPLHEATVAPGRAVHWGYVAAYAVEDDQVVEIWLQIWSPDPVG